MWTRQQCEEFNWAVVNNLKKVMWMYLDWAEQYRKHFTIVNDLWICVMLCAHSCFFLPSRRGLQGGEPEPCVSSARWEPCWKSISLKVEVEGRGGVRLRRGPSEGSWDACDWSTIENVENQRASQPNEVKFLHWGVIYFVCLDTDKIHARIQWIVFSHTHTHTDAIWSTAGRWWEGSDKWIRALLFCVA